MLVYETYLAPITTTKQLEYGIALWYDQWYWQNFKSLVRYHQQAWIQLSTASSDIHAHGI